MTRPLFVKGSIHKRYYDGIDDDLLTAGIGQEGLKNYVPTLADPENPTAAELRRGAIATNYKALVDLRAKAGYGSLYGPAVAGKFGTPTKDGKVAGKEYMAYSDDGSGKKNVTMMLQIPDSFDRDNPCIVATASPGSRGAYGAIAVGEWGLKNRCAVVYTDKGGGVGVHDLHTDTVNRMDGTRGSVAEVGEDANFIAEGSAETDLETYNRNYPCRVAHKHAHSQQNPEADWGKNVLEAIEFAYYILNLEENFGSGQQRLTPENTIVIAAGISNGGGSALLAAEKDSQGLIDAVVASEPNINPRKLLEAEGFSIVQGSKIYPHSVHGKTLFDSATFGNIYQPSASAGTMLALGADPAKGIPEKGGFPAGMPGRCAALRQAGLLKSDTLAEQIAESQKLLNDSGILESANTMAHIYNAFFVYGAIAVLYGNSYGRFSVTDNLCGYSYACSLDNNPPSPKSKANLASDFFLSSGIPPANGTNIINNKGNNGAGINYRYSVDENNNFDEYLEGALCLRKLATGTAGVTKDSGVPLSGRELDNFNRVRGGIEEILAGGNLQGKPAIIVHGRDDALIHVNFHSRSYYGLNQKVEGDKSNLVYVEVKNAHHFDAFNQAFDMDSKVPLFYYFQQALDLVCDYLKNGVDLPKSQVVSTVPLETTGGEKLTPEKNLPDLKSEVVNEITFGDDVLNIPEG